jgi:hypothetical protein
METEPHLDRVLAELQKIVAFFIWQKKLTNRMLIGVAVFIVLGILVAIIAERRVTKELSESVLPTATAASWGEVDRAMREGDLGKAAERGEAMITKMPGYPIGHEKLGIVYVSAGDLKKAEQHFAEAYRLLPTEANRQNLEAIRKRIGEQK